MGLEVSQCELKGSFPLSRLHEISQGSPEENGRHISQEEASFFSLNRSPGILEILAL